MASRALCFRILISSFANNLVSEAACLAWDGVFWPRLLALTIDCRAFCSSSFRSRISRSSLRVLDRIKLLHFLIYRYVSAVCCNSSWVEARTCAAGSGFQKTALRDSMIVEVPLGSEWPSSRKEIYMFKSRQLGKRRLTLNKRR